MPITMALLPAPRHLIHRIARGPEEPFDLPNWERAGDDGTFGNRFDDPVRTMDIPVQHRFRVIYCATQREAAFAEVTSRFRQHPGLPSALSLIEDDEETVGEALAGAVDPDHPHHGLLESDWLQRRRIGSTRIVTDRQFVNIDHADTLAHLNENLALFLQLMEVDELDLSAITRSTPRILTQAASRYIYQHGYAGIRYSSRLGSNWECWALFEGRFGHDIGYPGPPENIAPDNEDLINAARRFGLTIETIRGMGHFLRPWER